MKSRRTLNSELRTSNLEGRDSESGVRSSEFEVQSSKFKTLKLCAALAIFALLCPRAEAATKAKAKLSEAEKSEPAKPAKKEPTAEKKSPEKKETPAQKQLLALPPMPVLLEIPPPYPHMVWFEPSEGIEGRLKVSKLAVAERRKIGQQWTIAVTGFQKPDPKNPSAPIPPELKRLTFFFAGGQLEKKKDTKGKVQEQIKNGQLVEVELQYAQDGWTEEDYDTCLGEKRRRLEASYGTGQQIVRTTTDTPDGTATQSLVGYKWVRKTTLLELIYFSLVATEGDRRFHTLSFHYKRI